jgi:hypothetical protein
MAAFVCRLFVAFGMPDSIFKDVCRLCWCWAVHGFRRLRPHGNDRNVAGGVLQAMVCWRYASVGGVEAVHGRMFHGSLGACQAAGINLAHRALGGNGGNRFGHDFGWGLRFNGRLHVHFGFVYALAHERLGVLRLMAVNASGGRMYMLGSLSRWLRYGVRNCGRGFGCGWNLVGRGFRLVMWLLRADKAVNRPSGTVAARRGSWHGRRIALA